MTGPAGSSPPQAPAPAPAPVPPAPASPPAPPQPAPLPGSPPASPPPESLRKRLQQSANHLGGCAQALAALVIAGVAGWWAFSEWHETQSFELQKRFTAPTMQAAYQRLFDMQICNWSSAERGLNDLAFAGNAKRVGADEDLMTHLFFFRDARICVEGNVCNAERTCGDFTPWAEYLSVTLGDTILEQRIARNSRGWGSEFDDFLRTCQGRGLYTPSKLGADRYFRYDLGQRKRVPVKPMTDAEAVTFHKIEQFRDESLQVRGLEECLADAQAGSGGVKDCGAGNLAELRTRIAVKRTALRDVGPHFWTHEAACRRLERRKTDDPQGGAQAD